MSTKACTKCGQTKELDLFYLRPQSRDGRQSAAVLLRLCGYMSTTITRVVPASGLVVSAFGVFYVTRVTVSWVRLKETLCVK